MHSIGYGGTIERFSISFPFFEPLNVRLLSPEYFLLLASFIPFLHEYLLCVNRILGDVPLESVCVDLFQLFLHGLFVFEDITEDL